MTAEQSGTTVTVTSPRRDADDHTMLATLTLTCAETTDRTLIPEQVLQERNRGLRNTVAFLRDDIETVRLRTSEQVAERVVGYNNADAGSGSINMAPTRHRSSASKQILVHLS